MRVAGWCGPHPGATPRRCGRSSTPLGADRCALITHVSADAADWIADVVTERCPAAIRCADPFHVVAWATEALDAERRRAWNDARALARSEPTWGRGRPANDTAPRPGRERTRHSRASGMRCGRTPRTSPNARDAKLAWVAKTDTRLYRAYLLKEGLRHVFSVKGEEGKQALDRVDLPGHAVAASRCSWNWPAESSDTGWPSTPHSNTAYPKDWIESTNTKIRLLTRIAFGFRSPEALIALAMLALGGHRHRTTRTHQTPTEESVEPYSPSNLSHLRPRSWTRDARRARMAFNGRHGVERLLRPPDQRPF